MGMISIVVVLAACGSSAAETTSGACKPDGSHTLALSPQARVYSLDKTVYGCAYSTGKQRQLGKLSSCVGSHQVEAVDVAGVLAGYGLRTCGVDTGGAEVIVRRLTDGKVLTRRIATERSTGAESYQSVGSLALKADGSIAWIGVGQSIIGRGETIEVRRVEAGDETLLDFGRAIHPGSLRLHGSTLTWKHGKHTRSAQLS